MPKNKWFSIVTFLLFSIFLGCTSNKPKGKIIRTELDVLFAENFYSLKVPDNRWIKERSVSRSFPEATFEQVWDSAIIVFLQKGIVAHADKDKGTIVIIYALPFMIFVEKNDIINVYLKWMDYLYRGYDEPEILTIKFKRYKKKAMAKDFLDQLATQIYSQEKWKYLY